MALSLVRQARRRAQKKGLPFDLTADDLEIPDFCPALGIPLYRAAGCKAQGPHSPTLDRLNPDRGYVRDNVLVVSARANQIKSDAAVSELYRVACYYMQAEHTLHDP